MLPGICPRLNKTALFRKKKKDFFLKLEMTSVSIYRVQVKRSSKMPNFSVWCERVKLKAACTL